MLLLLLLLEVLQAQHNRDLQHLAQLQAVQVHIPAHGDTNDTRVGNELVFGSCIEMHDADKTNPSIKHGTPSRSHSHF
jgi:hypothetical protein